MMIVDVLFYEIQLNKEIADGGVSAYCDGSGDWMKSLSAKIAENVAINKVHIR